MRKSVLALLVGSLAAVTASAATVVMRVNGAGVTDVELAQARRGAAAAQGQQQDDQAVLRRAVEQVIGHVLLVQAAREAGIGVDPRELERFLAAQRSRYADQAAFEQALAAHGLTVVDLRSQEEENLLIKRFTESTMAPKANPTKEQARAYYDAHPAEFDHPEQVKVQMILVSLSENASDLMEKEAKSRVSQAAARLAAGEDFAKVASETSDDPSRAQGGMVGWVRRGQLLPELDPAVWELAAGKSTKPLRSKYGYHIMRAAERRPAGRSSFDEVEPTLRDMMKANAVLELMRNLVAERRAKAKVETLDPSIAAVLQAGGAPGKP